MTIALGRRAACGISSHSALYRMFKPLPILVIVIADLKALALRQRECFSHLLRTHLSVGVRVTPTWTTRREPMFVDKEQKHVRKNRS
jgi:hypothetical protein